MQLLTAHPILDAIHWESFATQSPKTLAILLVGTDPASELYVSIKERTATKYNVQVRVCRLPEDTTQADLVAEVEKLNSDPTCDALIVQLPLPNPEMTDAVLAAIDPRKDVDNLTGKNVFHSPMVLAATALQEAYSLEFTNKKICIVGQGVVVGQPLAAYFESQGYAVARIDKDTPNADTLIKEADVLFGATGVRHRINLTNTRPGQVVFDCSGQDVDFEAVKDSCTAITPPKGGLGPLTVHFLLTNVRAA